MEIGLLSYQTCNLAKAINPFEAKFSAIAAPVPISTISAYLILWIKNAGNDERNLTPLTASHSASLAIRGPWSVYGRADELTLLVYYLDLLK